MNPVIYIVWPWSNHSSYQADQLMQAVRTRGGRASVLNLMDHLPEEIAELEKPAGLIFNHYITSMARTRMDKLKEWHVPGINDVDAQMLISNKWTCYQRLEQQNIRIPYTRVLVDPLTEEAVEQTLEAMGDFPLVIKPLFGHLGEDVSLVETPNEFRSKVNEILAIRKSILVQRRVQNAKGNVALSAFCIGEDVKCMIRVGSPYEDSGFKQDTTSGRLRIPFNVSHELRDFCQSVRNAVGAHVVRLDILIGQDGYNVIDVNTPGGFEGFDKILGGNHADQIVSLLMERINDNAN